MRYDRQLKLLGETNRKLQKAEVAIVGIGGIGSVSSLLCAEMGVKKLKLVDYDEVHESNLARQALFTEKSIGKNKAKEAAKILREVNPGIEITAVDEALDEGNAKGILEGATVVLDGSDNYKARNAVNKHCVSSGTPWIYAAAIKFEAMLSTIIPGKTACFECFGENREAMLSCRQVGVLNSTTSFIASLQVQEMANLLCFNAPKFAGKLFYADLKNALFHAKELKRREGCGVCGKK